MLFKRRTKPSISQRARQLLLPRGGPMRVLRYWGYRIVRISDTPHSIAAGVASGAAVSFTPFLGAHFVLAFVFALISRGNLFAAAIGTVVGNPWTFPIFFALTNSIGMLILGESTSTEVPAWSWGALYAQPVEYIVSYWPLIRTMAAGSVPVAILIWVVFYVGVKGAITGYKSARRERTERQSAARHISSNVAVNAACTVTDDGE